MNLQAILAKTAKGTEELETRKYKLDQRTRALLIVVNGKSSVTELLKKFEQMGDVTPMLEKLLADGFIADGAGAAPAAAAAAPAGDHKAARAQLAHEVTEALGPDGDTISEQIEKCGSMQDLKNYVDTKRAMLEAVLGKKGAPFWAKAKELLG